MLKIGTFCFYCKTRVCKLRRRQEKEKFKSSIPKIALEC